MHWKVHPLPTGLDFKKVLMTSTSDVKLTHISSLLCFVIRKRNFILKTSATAGLFLWMVVLSLQCIHEWNHHHTHHIEGVCHHHHAHSNVPSEMEAGASVAEECLICDWDWVPFESIHPMDSKILDQQWQQRFKIGLAERGYSSNHNNQTKSHRGPPKRG